PRAAAPSPPASPAPPVPPAPQRVTELLLQVDVNWQRLDEPVLVLRREDGTLLIAGEDLDRWRLRRPSTAPYEHEGRLFYPSSDLPWLKLSLDERTQTLTISADPQAFAGTVQAVTGQRYPPPVLPQPGGFFNYTLSERASRTRPRATAFSKRAFSASTAFSPAAWSRPTSRAARAGCGSIRPTRSIIPASSLAFASATRSPGRARGGARCVSAARSMAPTSAPSRDSFVPRSCRPPGRPCSRPPSTSS